MKTPSFSGSTYTPSQDGTRLSKQLVRVRQLMLDGKWRSLKEISKAVKAPEASVSARLRDLRKDRFGGYTVDRERAGSTNGTWLYRVSK